MARPVIALLTDFGLKDHYVGVMKGVMLGICPDASLVDISHDIPPQDIAAAAEELAASRPYFPPRTVFLVVVDPGVGSSRRAIAVECGGQLFVGPDNGVLSAVTGDDEPWRGVELTNPQYRLADVSRTFEGRDRFAPAAAWLASGVEITVLGPAIEQATRVAVAPPRRDGTTIDGRVRRVDRFGNLVTDLRAADLTAVTRPVIEIGGRTIDGLVHTYADAAPHALCALVGSTGFLEVAVSGGSAADTLDLGRGALVRLRQGA
jgi:S-adenosylmethionine hydrolase